MWTVLRAWAKWRVDWIGVSNYSEIFDREVQHMQAYIILLKMPPHLHFFCKTTRTRNSINFRTETFLIEFPHETRYSINALKDRALFDKDENRLRSRVAESRPSSALCQRIWLLKSRSQTLTILCSLNQRFSTELHCWMLATWRLSPGQLSRAESSTVSYSTT